MLPSWQSYDPQPGLWEAIRWRKVLNGKRKTNSWEIRHTRLRVDSAVSASLKLDANVETKEEKKHTGWKWGEVIFESMCMIHRNVFKKGKQKKKKKVVVLHCFASVAMATSSVWSFSTHCAAWLADAIRPHWVCQHWFSPFFPFSHFHA